MIHLKQPQFPLKGNIPLVASKSESNRALIIAALSGASRPQNLSEARDTQTLMRILEEDPPIWDVLDAGAPMRFLTAFAAVVKKERKLTGTARMQERPIGILVDALRKLGASIDYEKKEGYPPILVQGNGSLKGETLTMDGNVSSQFVSAILLIAPYLPGGLKLQLSGPYISSRPYINMTMRLMHHYSAAAEWTASNVIQVGEGRYKAEGYVIESDWSAASYWYSLVALAPEGSLFLEGLRKDSFQGDAVISKLMEPFGVESVFEKNGVRISQTGKIDRSPQSIDCSDFPDLAQTLAVTAAGLDIPLTLSGLQSLRIKETDRIFALQQELGNFGKSFLEEEKGHFTVKGKFTPGEKAVKTYDDHRMAMAFAPLVLLQQSLKVENPDVVEKKLPGFLGASFRNFEMKAFSNPSLRDPFRVSGLFLLTNLVCPHSSYLLPGQG